jgi:pimeloyl-ACP methyl ester carboxylesterase
MPSFARDNLEFHYLDRGTGVPVIFQHGLGGDTEKIFELLALPQGFRLLGMDCRAHGKTTPLGDIEKLRFDSMADDLVALLNHLGITRAVFGGTSMGAGIALNCALRYPNFVLGLALLRPAWLDVPNQANADLFGFIASLIRDHGPVAGLDIFKKSDAYRTLAGQCPDSGASLMGLFLNPRALETVARLEQVPRDCPNRDRSAWRRISAPAIVMTTREDPIHPFDYAQTLAREIAGAEFHELAPKSTDLARYVADLRRCLDQFLQVHFT